MPNAVALRMGNAAGRDALDSGVATTGAASRLLGPVMLDVTSIAGELYILLEVFVAAALAGVIGLDRELCRRPAGMRTHMLVAAAAALLVGLGQTLAEHAQFREGFIADPVRIIQAVIAGVSFLGAGTIFRSRDGEYVEGLTTAATLLLAAGIGVSVALRQWVTAVGVTILAVAVLRSIVPLERWALRRAGTEDKEE